MAPRPIGASKDVSRRALTAMRKGMARRIVNALGRDPELLDQMTETGLLNREWVENPGDGPMMTEATPLEVLERTLAGIVERRPSKLAALGLSAIEVLAVSGDDVGNGARAHDLAVCFTDLQGFTAFTADRGDVAASRLLAEHYKAAGPIVRSRGGRIVKRLGDGLMITFSEPTAAVLAAVELVDCPPRPLQVRAGLHVGEVLIDRADIVGHVVNIAARVAETASGGEVLISRELHDALLTEELPQLEIGRSRRRRLKGVNDRIEVFPVQRARRPVA
ncbi:MAG: adenylate/guanylate cyclase domain-containing protein [Actinomycetes bacterium]